MSIDFITNEQLYKQAIEPVVTASSFVWIGTADIKDLHVHYKGKVQSFLGVLDSLLKKKVAIRLLHAKEPGPNFRRSFDNYPMLWDRMERQLCPRVHSVLPLQLRLTEQVKGIMEHCVHRSFSEGVTA